MENLKVLIVQATVKWHDPAHNFENFDSLLSQANKSDIILLPEMWATGFTMKAEKYADSGSDALELMKKWSLEKNSTVIGSLIFPENNKMYNRLFVVEQGSVTAQYDKRHLFAYSGEDIQFEAGRQKKIISIGPWKICLNICYDLRFPVWSRNFEDYHVYLNTSNWPDKRILAWHTLLSARAIENQCYSIGSNCHGEDPWQNTYKGHSMAYRYDGEAMMEPCYGEQLIPVNCSMTALMDFKEKLPFLKDRDDINSVIESMR